MIRRPPRSTRTDTLFPYTTLFRSFLAATPKLAGSSVRQVVTAPLELIDWIDEHLASSDADHAALRARVRDVYGPRLAQLGIKPRADDSDGDRLLRAALINELADFGRSEEHTSELQSLMRISYAVFCLKKKNNRFEST